MPLKLSQQTGNQLNHEGTFQVLFCLEPCGFAYWQQLNTKQKYGLWFCFQSAKALIPATGRTAEAEEDKRFAAALAQDTTSTAGGKSSFRNKIIIFIIIFIYLLPVRHIQGGIQKGFFQNSN